MCALASAVALLIAAVAGGMFAGNLVVGRLVRPTGRERLVGSLALALGLPLLGFALRPAPGHAALVSWRTLAPPRRT